jgi:uncharacterized RmlC-like cupin family protein
MVTEAEYPPIRIVSPGEFDAGTAQTPGSLRLAAVAPQLGVQSAMWGGLFEVKPGARTCIHHHGEQQTIAYACRASAKSVGAREVSTLRAQRPATSSTCRLSCHTWRSILRIRSLFGGSS